jgi:hypothetical protein
MACTRVNQGSRAQPGDDFIGVRRIEYRVKGVIRPGTTVTACKCNQMKVVIAQYYDRTIAQTPHESQRLQRFRATIDQVAYEPEEIAVSVKPYLLQQRTKL